MKAIFRKSRALFYRFLPSKTSSCWQKKIAGFERRWNLEQEGFTKKGFMRVLWRHVLYGVDPGKFLELVAGDGLVGSVGVWLEKLDPAWEVEAWEHRGEPFRSFQKNRPGTPVYPVRLTNWTDGDAAKNPLGITTRGAREAAGVCRAIRLGRISPKILGIWNPRRRPVWFRRLKKQGYRLELVWQNIEIYRCRHP